MPTADAKPMTAETDLLPLPEWTKRDDAGQNMVPSEIRVAMADYARAALTAALAPSTAAQQEGAP